MFLLYLDSYSSTRRSFTHWARRILRKPRTGPGTRCDTGQKGHTKRVPDAFGTLSTITDQPDRHRRNKTCGGGANRDETFAAGFAADFAAGFGACLAVRRETDLRADELRRVARRDVRVAVMSMLPLTRRAGFIFTSTSAAKTLFVQAAKAAVALKLEWRS
jgi:hypothetical protein